MSDYVEWKRKVFKHLGEYKRSVIGIPGNTIIGDKEYEHILPYGTHFANYMCEQAINESSKIKKHHEWYHLNSSQTICINFFARLFDENNYRGLNKVIGSIIKRKEPIEIVKATFEYELDSKQRSTNFDFYCEDKQQSRYYFEIKYTEEDFKNKTDASNPEKTFNEIYKPLIENSDLLSVFPADNWEKFMKHNYQINRNAVMASSKEGDCGYCIFITMQSNQKTRTQLEAAIQDLGNPPNVISIYWEDLINDVINNIFSEKNSRGRYKDPVVLGYYKEFYKKYINIK